MKSIFQASYDDPVSKKLFSLTDVKDSYYASEYVFNDTPAYLTRFASDFKKNAINNGLLEHYGCTANDISYNITCENFDNNRAEYHNGVYTISFNAKIGNSENETFAKISDIMYQEKKNNDSDFSQIALSKNGSIVVLNEVDCSSPNRGKWNINFPDSSNLPPFTKEMHTAIYNAFDEARNKKNNSRTYIMVGHDSSSPGNDKSFRFEIPKQGFQTFKDTATEYFKAQQESFDMQDSSSNLDNESVDIKKEGTIVNMVVPMKTVEKAIGMTGYVPSDPANTSTSLLDKLGACGINFYKRMERVASKILDLSTSTHDLVRNVFAKGSLEARERFYGDVLNDKISEVDKQNGIIRALRELVPANNGVNKAQALFGNFTAMSSSELVNRFNNHIGFTKQLLTELHDTVRDRLMGVEHKRMNEPEQPGAAIINTENDRYLINAQGGAPDQKQDDNMNSGNNMKI